MIPKKARELFKIATGDSLLILGDETQGIALAKHDKFTQFVKAVCKAEECTEE